MKLILDDGTETKVEEIKGPALLLIQPKEQLSNDKLESLAKSIIPFAEGLLARHGLSLLVANADIKFTVIRKDVPLEGK